VQVTVLSAYGDARIWIEDLGYEPADPLATPPPECANGIDDNHNGLIDYPSDPGCYAPNDNTEDTGTYETGVSETLYYVYPRIADVRGVSTGGSATSFPNQQVQINTEYSTPIPTPLPTNVCDLTNVPASQVLAVCTKGNCVCPTSSGTPLDGAAWQNFASQLTSIYNQEPGGTQCITGTLPAPPAGCTMSPAEEQQYCQCLSIDRNPTGDIVTGLSSSGFFVSDVNDPRGYSSVFAYNYTAPPNMFVCDRLIGFGGTSSDFYGWTEINYPAWELDEWDPTARNCFIPDPHVFSIADLASVPARLNQESALVRVMQNDSPGGVCYGPGPGCVSYPISDAACVNPCGTMLPSPLGAAVYSIHIGGKIGPNHPPQTGANAYLPTADATNCDYEGTGKVDFTAGTPDDMCATACAADPECSEYSQYLSNQQFNIVVDNGSNTPIVALADGASSQTFNPVASKGQNIGSFSGDIVYFSGGSSFTITARCSDDIVMDTTQPPLPSDKACVIARTIADQPSF
jgi:hypothetical protein